MTSSLKKKAIELLNEHTRSILNTDIRPTADQYTTDSWPIYHQQLTDTPPRYDRLSTDISTAVSVGSTYSNPKIILYFLTELRTLTIFLIPW